jgi:hypothetical protein
MVDEVRFYAGGLVSSYLLVKFLKKQTFCFVIKNKCFTFALHYGKEKNYRKEIGSNGQYVIPPSAARQVRKSNTSGAGNCVANH